MALLKPLPVTQIKALRVHGAAAVSFEVKGAPEVLWKRLRAVRERDGWRLLVRYPTKPSQIRVTLERRHERLTLILSLLRRRKGIAAGVIQLQTPPARSARLRGACVKVPERRFEIMVHSSSGRADPFGGGGHAPQSIRWTYNTRFDHDFDGDGLLDALVPLSKRAYCPSSVKETIYITRCDKSGRCCGHVAGTLDGDLDVDQLRKARPDRGGAKPVVTTLERTESRTRIPDRITYTRRYRFKGGRYRMVHRKRSGGRCHHCRTPSCSGPIRVRHCPLALPDRLSFAAIGVGMKQAAKLAHTCYKAPLKTAKGGLISVKVDVAGKSGAVTKVGFYKPDPLPPRLKRCVEQALRQVRFPTFCEPTVSFSGPLRSP